MTVKEYLREIRRLETVIAQKRRELMDLRDMATSISGIDYTKDRVQSAVQDAPFVRQMEQICKLETELRQEIDDYIRKRHTIVNQIQGLQNNKHIEVLYRHYVQFQRLEQVAEEMGYTYQYTIELHGHAIKTFRKTYKNLLKTY